MFNITPFGSNLSSLFNDDFFNSLWEVPERNSVSFDETDNELTLFVEMPGFERGRISMLREENILSITANREYKTNGGSKTRSFQRRLLMPKYVDLEQIDAEYKEGILTIKVKKREDLKPKPIEIR